jgi:PleD family two-component response regulator
MSAHRSSGYENALRKIIMLGCVKISLMERENVLGASHGKSVRLRAANVENCIALLDALAAVSNATRLVIRLTNAASRAVNRKDKGSFFTVVGI